MRDGNYFDVNSMPAGLQSTSLDPQNNPTNKVLLRSITEKRRKDSEMVTYFSAVTQVDKRQNLTPAQSVSQDTLSIHIPKKAVLRHVLAMHFICSHTFPHSLSMLNFEQCVIFYTVQNLFFQLSSPIPLYFLPQKSLITLFFPPVVPCSVHPAHTICIIT